MKYRIKYTSEPDWLDYNFRMNRGEFSIYSAIGFERKLARIIKFKHYHQDILKTFLFNKTPIDKLLRGI